MLITSNKLLLNFLFCSWVFFLGDILNDLIAMLDDYDGGLRCWDNVYLMLI